MKTILKTYLKTFLFIILSYLVLSILFAILLSLLPSFYHTYTILAQILSCIVVFCSAIYFYKETSNNLLQQACLFSFLYVVLTITLQFNHLSIFTVILRPAIFMITCLLLKILEK